ncbi:MAG: hypothetical protein KGI08_08825, partial [Thaumarchaeota archaeon]|nr:hypothetical protein [Nitrososphaerota archaeon]
GKVKMKTYVATFHGDLDGEYPPIVATSLDELLKDIQELTEYGKSVVVPEETYEGKTYPEYTQWTTPDPEDDKIEIWEFDTENKSAKLVTGFFGWHWQIPEGVEQMKMPGNDKSLYELAMEE